MRTNTASELALDHSGTICHDLAAGAARWEKLGFSLTPQAQQMVPGSGHNGLEPAATANRCAMLEQGYLELIGVTQPGRLNPWSHFVARHEGIHLLALRCNDADRFYATLSQRAAGFAAPVQRTRQVTEHGTTSELRFRSIYSNDAEYPEGRFIIIEHQTPESLWQPRYLAHPNTAIALTEVLIACRHIEPSAVRLAALTGVEPIAQADGASLFALSNGTSVRLQDHRLLSAQFGFAMHDLPAFYGATIAFRDRALAIKMMQENGVDLRLTADGGAWVGPLDTNGFVLQLTEAHVARLRP
jgi:hypothetical protein